MTLTLAEVRARHRGDFFTGLDDNMIKTPSYGTPDGCVFATTTHRVRTRPARRGYRLHRARLLDGDRTDGAGDVEISTFETEAGGELRYSTWRDARAEARLLAELLRGPDGDQRRLRGYLARLHPTDPDDYGWRWVGAPDGAAVAGTLFTVTVHSSEAGRSQPPLCTCVNTLGEAAAAAASVEGGRLDDGTVTSITIHFPSGPRRETTGPDGTPPGPSPALAPAIDERTAP